MVATTADRDVPVSARPSRGLAGALVAAVREHPVGEPVPELDRQVARHGVSAVGLAAHWHGVTGCLWTALRAGGLAERRDAAEVGRRYRVGVARHRRSLSELEHVDEVLGGAGTAYLLLEGPALAEHVYSSPDLRAAADPDVSAVLDVLVAPRDFPLALAALEESGCRVVDTDWQAARERMLGVVRLFTPAGGVLDLRWAPFASRDVRARHPVAADQLMRQAAVAVELAGRSVRTLDPVDALVHLALRASMSGGHRLVWLKDAEQVVLRAVTDWDRVVRRAAAWQAGPAVALVLGRTRATLGLPVPDAVGGELVPDRLWRAVLRLTDRITPVARSRGAASLAALVARSARADGRSSRHELARRSMPFLRPGEPAATGAAGAAQATPSRAAYLAEVSRQ